MKRVCLTGLLRVILCAVIFAGTLPGSASAGEVWVLDINGAIGPATADYVNRSLLAAEEAGAHLVVLRIDTPGGLDKAMREIIKNILASPVPVATWVTPSGARAASAGTYILYASHVAAMSPATNLGSATPVQIGVPGLPTPQPADEPEQSKDDEQQENGEKAQAPKPPASAMEKKVLNDAIAYIRGLAELRGRNVEWAEAAVRDAANLSASDALEQNVVDLIAESIDDLLAQIDGKTVRADNREITLATADLVHREIAPDWRNQFLATITDPNIAYILMLIGVYGLLLEFYNPGAIFPGVIGGICLLLAMYALQVLPVSYVGLGLILLGTALMIAEALVPSFGILGFGGITAFVIGSIILMDTTLPAFKIALPIIAAVTVVSAAALIFVLGMAIKARDRQLVSGSQMLIGETAVALGDFDNAGQVRIGGEIWHATSKRPVSSGEHLEVAAVHGLTVEVSDQHPSTESEESS